MVKCCDGLLQLKPKRFVIRSFAGNHERSIAERRIKHGHRARLIIRSVLAIPPIGAPESLRRSGPEARRDGAATRAQRALLTASTQGFRMRAPEGWRRFCSPARHR